MNNFLVQGNILVHSMHYLGHIYFKKLLSEIQA